MFLLFGICLLVIATVGIHLVVLEVLYELLPRLGFLTKLRVGVIILGAILGHLLEIFVFAIGLFFLSRSDDYGELVGSTNLDFLDHFYYSAVTYTSLGFGDITHYGLLRLVAAVEALTGLVLIAWTASFTFLVMQQIWGIKPDKKSSEGED